MWGARWRRWGCGRWRGAVGGSWPSAWKKTKSSKKGSGKHEDIVAGMGLRGAGGGRGGVCVDERRDAGEAGGLAGPDGGPDRGAGRTGGGMMLGRIGKWLR